MARHAGSPRREDGGRAFSGAESTLCIEAMMQDRKALQAGTSHFLGQNFSKACGIKFQGVEGKEEFGWTTSWGVSTRLIGGMIMTHADDDGLIVPPKVAPLTWRFFLSRPRKNRGNGFFRLPGASRQIEENDLCRSSCSGRIGRS